MAQRSEDTAMRGEALPTRLMAALYGEWERVERSGFDPLVMSDAQNRTVFMGKIADTHRRIERAMEPPPRAAPVRPSRPVTARTPKTETAQDEASMYDGIPDDPDALQAAIVERLTRVADLIELKRREDGAAALGGGGLADGGPAGPVQRHPD